MTRCVTPSQTNENRITPPSEHGLVLVAANHAGSNLATNHFCETLRQQLGLRVEVVAPDNHLQTPISAREGYFTFVALAVPAAVRIAAADLVADAEPHPPLIDLSDVTDAQTALDRIDRVVRGAGLATPLARLRVNSTALATTQHCGVVRYGLVAELTAARSRTALPSTALGRFSAGLREASGLTSQLRVSPPVPLTAWEIDGVRQNEPINSLEARPAVGAVVTRAAQLQIPRSPSELARLFDGLKPHTYTRLLFTTNQPILLDATPIRPARPATWSIKAAPPLDLWR